MVKRKLFLIVVAIPLIGSVIMSSCAKDKKDTPTPVISSHVYKGDFTSSAHPTSGSASINREKTELGFHNFKTDSGPDLNVYLVSDLSDIKSDYIDLGDIKGIDGNYSYALTDSIDFSKYKYVVVWCVKFDVNFGYATIEKVI